MHLRNFAYGHKTASTCERFFDALLSAITRFFRASFLLFVCLASKSEEPAFLIRSFSIQENRFEITVQSRAGGSYILQSSETARGDWKDVTTLSGTGEILEFSVPLERAQTFFRVGYFSGGQPLSLVPSAPTLQSDAVSLPDVVSGAPYEQVISVTGSGTPPFTFSISGDLPTGVTATVLPGDTTNAAVQIESSGNGLLAGERKQFLVTVSDAAGNTDQKSFDLRVIAPPPEIQISEIVLKAGTPTNVVLTTAEANGGPLIWNHVSGALPEGMTLSENGLLSGTPTAGSAEENETGIFTNVVQVRDGHTDRVTGELTPRTTTATLKQHVRLSFHLNIKPERPNGPSLVLNCSTCHGGEFPPDIEPDSAIHLVNFVSGSAAEGTECGSSYLYVKPGDPETSLVYMKITAPRCGERMPHGGPYLDAIQINRIYRWIKELRPGEID